MLALEMNAGESLLDFEAFSFYILDCKERYYRVLLQEPSVNTVKIKSRPLGFSASGGPCYHVLMYPATFSQSSSARKCSSNIELEPPELRGWVTPAVMGDVLSHNRYARTTGRLPGRPHRSSVAGERGRLRYTSP